ncbi:hypothetical protein NQ317_015378 [Molorchus minor]|uniref:CCHC-type domain-containing protein n=1 Tax=Molorchus minor TaxID=1323400 RepID=A0ABQ9J3L8_9CUCU|nr:hypothetical protein NQ317_015378 [Molorchus minor]
MGAQNQKRKHQDTEAIFVAKGGATMLKETKEKLKTDSAGAQGIRKIRKSKDGKMIIILAGEGGSSISELKEKQVVAKISLKIAGESRNTTLYIRNIEEINTREEVQETLERELGENSKLVQVGQLRPYYGGGHNIIVSEEKSVAKQMVKKKKIRIRLNWCQIAERKNVRQCYRCLAYGHRKYECRFRKDIGGKCRKCGQAGHKIKECRAEFCLSCDREGHKTGTGRCPEFRKALNKEKTRANRKKNTNS